VWGGGGGGGGGGWGLAGCGLVGFGGTVAIQPLGRTPNNRKQKKTHSSKNPANKKTTSQKTKPKNKHADKQTKNKNKKNPTDPIQKSTPAHDRTRNHTHQKTKQTKQHA